MTPLSVTTVPRPLPSPRRKDLRTHVKRSAQGLTPSNLLARFPPGPPLLRFAALTFTISTLLTSPDGFHTSERSGKPPWA